MGVGIEVLILFIKFRYSEFGILMPMVHVIPDWVPYALNHFSFKGPIYQYHRSPRSNPSNYRPYPSLAESTQIPIIEKSGWKYRIPKTTCSSKCTSEVWSSGPAGRLQRIWHLVLILLFGHYGNYFYLRTLDKMVKLCEFQWKSFP